MTLRKKAKFLTQKLGIFFPARELLQKLDPKIRAQFRKDLALYGGFVGRGAVVFDIGANLGQKAVVFLALGRRVVCVEPNPICADYLRRKFAGKPVEIVEGALGESAGTAVLNFVSTASTASLREDWAHFEGGGGDLERREVPVATVDALIARFGRPDFMKIDVEGYEEHVLRGLSEPVACLSFEYSLREIDRAAQCLELLAGLSGYAFNVIAMNGGAFHSADWLDAETLLGEIRGGRAPAMGDIFARQTGAAA